MTKEFIELNTHNDSLGQYPPDQLILYATALGIQSLNDKVITEYLCEQYRIATADVTEKKTFEHKVRKECVKALFDMEPTERTKEILKIKIGFIKYEVKGAYTKTVILAKGLENLNSTL